MKAKGNQKWLEGARTTKTLIFEQEHKVYIVT